MTSDHKALMDENAVLLISGGAKGITALCAIKIAETYRGRFILIGRSSIIDPEPDWATGIMEKAELQNSALSYYKQSGEKATPKLLQKLVGEVISSREIQSTLQQIREHGGEVMYISSDVNNKEHLSDQIQLAVSQFGAVTGVIHGAGTLADKLIENKKGLDFDRVVGTKINGLQNIIQSINVDKLRFLVLFSSVAGFFGNAGQTDYAIANEILNKSAFILNKSLPNCRVICVNWGPWDAGMVSPKLKKILAERKIELISTRSGVQALLDELDSNLQGTPQIVVGSPIKPDIEFRSFRSDRILLHRRMNLERNPFLNDHRIGPHTVLPATCAASWLVDACQSFNPGYSLYRIKDFKVLKGITIDDKDFDCDIELNLIPEQNNGNKEYEVKVTSRNNNSRTIFHYSAQVALAKELPVSPVHTPGRELGLDRSKIIDGSQFYQNGILFHGPSFRGIQEVLQLNENGVISQVALPRLDELQQGQFPVRNTNPFINDAIVQNLLIWTQEFYGSPCLPSRLHQLDHYQLIPFGCQVWAILKITYHNEHAVIGDILVQDEEGRELLSFTGLEGTISKHLKRFIGKQNV